MQSIMRSEIQIEQDLINIDAISNKDWENFTVVITFTDKYQYYIHTSNDPITIGGGPYGEQQYTNSNRFKYENF